MADIRISLRDFYGFRKQAADPVPSMSFSGRLVRSSSGWILLELPNSFVRGAFHMLDVPGAELPTGPTGKLKAHISVIRPQELEDAGIGEITELGRRFKFQVGTLKEVNPLGWDDMERVWFLTAMSPELEKLRRSYGLTGRPMKGSKTLNFHITVAVRRRKVLSNNREKKRS